MGVTELAAIAGILLTLGGGLVSLFLASNKKRDGRIEQLEVTVYGSHANDGIDTKLAVLNTEQKNTCARLTELKESVEENSGLLRDLLLRLAQ